MELGKILVQSGAIDEEQLENALQYQQSIGGHVGQILVKLGFLSEEELLSHLSEQLQIPVFDLRGFRPDPDCMERFPREVLERLDAVPIKRERNTFTLGVSDPTDFAGLDELRLHAGGNTETVLVSHSAARDALNAYYEAAGERDGEGEDGADLPRSRPRRSARGALSELVHELERDARLREGGVLDEAPPAAEQDADTEPASATAEGGEEGWGALSTRSLLISLIAALIDRGVLREEDVTLALTRLLREKGHVPEE